MITVNYRILLVLLTVLATSCGIPYFISSNFEEITVNHKRIAILPFEMIYTGKQPDKMTQEQLDQISAAESKAFQISFHDLLLRSTKNGKKALRVDVQHFDKTNRIFENNNVPVEDVLSLSSEELCKMLNVDAVVRCRVEKTRFMSDLASYGIDIGVELINILSNYALWPFIPGGLNVSKEIKSNYTLLDHENGTTLWSTSYSTEADWSASSNEIIESVIGRSVKRFPYRR
ncbi:MAG: hypothetical protein HKN22_03180 [Bacteroidia bacterium]|nr:hypothetical protein [Bacteroidia bacterium]